ncbi:MAG TPA: signal peptidase I [Gammaproteobacteria bacterium]|nr:signal peptidase I [Gammaproteobacteria bacterium]
MSFDFALILVIGTLVTGVIWAVDVIWFAPKRKAAAGGGEVSTEGAEAGEAAAAAQSPQEPLLVEYARSFFPVILVVLLLRSFVVEPFRIPSGSMLPTLFIGDFILVSKFSYGLRLPVLDTKFLDTGEPHRGDVMVFRYPRNPSEDYIKRVIGVPGDKVEYRNKVLYINGKKMSQMPAGHYIDSYGQRLDMRLEDLGGVKHDIIINPAFPGRDFSVTVPPHSYFAMGDNRDNSNDSRVWGFVPEANLVGRAFLIWMNWDSEQSSVRWGRIGTVIH